VTAPCSPRPPVATRAWHLAAWIRDAGDLSSPAALSHALVLGGSLCIPSAHPEVCIAAGRAELSRWRRDHLEEVVRAGLAAEPDHEPAPSPALSVSFDPSTNLGVIIGDDQTAPICEGADYELLDIARAVRQHARRLCMRGAVDARYDVVRVWDPRRDESDGHEMNRDEAEELAATIERTLGAATWRQRLRDEVLATTAGTRILVADLVGRHHADPRKVEQVLVPLVDFGYLAIAGTQVYSRTDKVLAAEASR